MTTPAVVEIQGDSSHLQAALKASAQAMKAVETETAAMGRQFQDATAEIGKTADALTNKLSGAKSGGLSATKAEAGKLTDMLKQVAKDADLAAGSIVDGLGGVPAIKAAGAISLGVTGVTAALSGFNNMAVAAFSRYGDEGQAAASLVSSAFDDLTGVFADAVIGQENVTQAGNMLAGAWNNLKDAATFALAPLKLLSEGFFSLTGTTDNSTAAIDDNAAALKALQRVQGTTAENTKKVEGDLAAANRMANERLGKTLEVRKQDYDAQTKQLEAGRESLRQIAIGNAAIQDFDASVKNLGKTPASAMQLVMGRDENGKLLPELEDNLMAKSVARATAALEDNAKVLEYLNPLQREEFQNISAGISKTFESVIATEKATQASKDAEAQARAEAAARRAIRREAKQDEPELGVEGQITVDPSKLQAVAKGYKAIGDAIADATNQVKQYIDFGELDKNRTEAFQAARLAVHKSTNTAIVESDKTANDAMNKALHDRLTEAAKAGYKSMMTQIGQAKTVEEAARGAIGGIVSALGDEFMIRAGAAFLTGNIPGGVGFTALAGGAYALAGALGSKKGPAAETPPTASAGANYEKTENVTYSLRVDAQFADGESIARRFAQMHEGARQRGLIAVPA